jgi:hypothetical protein
MKVSAVRRLLIFIALTAVLAVPATVLAQEAPQGSAEVNEFYLHPSTTQAGGHPDMHLFFRFCDPIPHVVNATNTSPVVITTLEPHGLATGDVITVRGIRGNLAANTGTQHASATVLSANMFELRTVGGAPITGNGAYQGGGWVSKWNSSAGSPPLHGCAPAQQNMQIRRFLLKLAPGLLGNPEAVEVCPYEKWVYSNNRSFPGQGCPPNSQVGHSNTRTVTVPPAGGMIPVGTGLYRIPTVGLEPARLGTDFLIGDPPGPVPIAITLRTSAQRPPADYGINSAIIDLPKNLGGPQATIAEIETVLCGYAPCSVTPNPPENTNYETPTGVHPLPGARPFFVNPTRCDVPAISNLQAWSWLHPEVLAEKTSTDIVNGAEVPSSTPTGCENVPFDAHVRLDTDTTAPGAPVEQIVTLDYGHDFSNDAVWQSALRDADIKLPEGMTLSPGGGVGLEGCDFAQLGVDTNGKQVNDDPPTCPDGSQVGTLSVETPVLPEGSLKGKVFFGCNRTSADQPCLAQAGRPTPENPWKLFLYIEGAGLRIKLVGDVDVSPSGQVHNRFLQQPQVPFERLEVRLRGGDRAILANPEDCDTHSGTGNLTGWADTDAAHKRTSSPLTITPTGCPPEKPFAPQIVQAGSDPEQAGATTTSHILITRGDGEKDIKSLHLSLPPGAVGSLAAVPQCDIANARAGTCSPDSKIGSVKTTVGSGTSLLSAAGSLYLAEPSVPGDAATLALTVPAKAGPIDLGQVVVLNRVVLRDSDTGVDAITSEIPNILEGVPLHVRQIEITVDRPGFFLNPTGCDPRPLTATFTAYDDTQSSSTMMLNAKGCENLDFGPRLRMIAGAKGQNGQLEHPPLTAIVTQAGGEANIKSAQVVLPDLLRPNTPQFNIPGGLCSDTEFAQGACPEQSNVGSARVITPVLPFQLAGPVYVVQEVGSILPKLYVVLEGEGLRVVLRARNSFQGIKTVNTFETLPDVPQAYFELKIDGGPGGILNNFYEACTVSKIHRKIDYTFTGHNGSQVKKTTYLQQDGCAGAASLGARVSAKKIEVNRKGVGKLKMRCRASKRCGGSIKLTGKGVKAAKRFSIPATTSKVVKLKFSKKEVRKIFRKKRVKTRSVTKVGKKSTKSAITLVPKR